MKPLPRLLYLSIGPLVSQVILAAFGLLDAFWATKTRTGSDVGLAVLGNVYVMEYVVVAIAQFFMTGYSTRASYCFGRCRTDAASQLLIDFFRMVLIACALTAAVVLPAAKPLIGWYGGSDLEGDFLNICFDYVTVQVCVCPLKYTYLLVCGVAECEGRVLVFSVLQIGALVLDQVVAAILVLGFKAGLTALPLARGVGEGAAALVGFFWAVLGSQRVSLRCRMLIAGFSRDTWPAVQSGFAGFLLVMFECFPSCTLQKFLTSAAAKQGEEDLLAVLGLWNLLGKSWVLIGGVCMGIGFGLLPAAGFSWGRKRMADVRWLCFHALWVATVVSVSLALPIIIWPTKIAALWNSDPLYLDWASDLLPRMYYGCLGLGMLYVSSILVQALQHPVIAIVMEGCTQFVPVPCVAAALYLTDKADPARVMLACPICDLWGFIVSTLMFAWQMRAVWRIEREAALDVSIASREVPRKCRSDPGYGSLRTDEFMND